MTSDHTVPAPRDWYPLESSPEVFAQLAKAWGVPERYTFLDVFSLDEDAIATLTPEPVHAVILLFPDTDAIVDMRRKEKCMDAGSSEIVWIPQVDVGHSCGTFALVHALGQTDLAPTLRPFFSSCRAATPPERTALFATSKEIYNAHHDAITAGQTLVRDSDWEDAAHFLSFVYAEVEGECRLVELDGNPPRDGPLDRGEASGDLLRDVAKVVREKYIPLADDNIHFSMLALVG